MRDELRKSILNQKAQDRLVELSTGQKVLLKAPSLKSRGQIIKFADGDKADMAMAQIQAVIACCFDPETKEQLFDQSDVEVLLNMPSNSVIDELSKAASELLNPESASEAKND